MNVSVQKRIASKILNCGVSRVWVDPERLEEVSMALTREDVRRLIDRGIIKKKQDVGISRGRVRKRKLQKEKGRRKGYGSRKGKKTARYPKKLSWMKRIRALRRELKEMRNRRDIEKSTHRKLYSMAKGGSFRSVSHLKSYIEEKKLLRKRR